MGRAIHEVLSLPYLLCQRGSETRGRRGRIIKIYAGGRWVPRCINAREQAAYSHGSPEAQHVYIALTANGIKLLDKLFPTRTQLTGALFNIKSYVGISMGLKLENLCNVCRQMAMLYLLVSIKWTPSESSGNST
jgi:hypothetical protein